MNPQSDQPDVQTILRPFSGELRVDEELKLSRENFIPLIENFFKDKTITPLSQLTATPPFPTPHVLAQFASKAYTDYKTRETDAQYETRLDFPEGWKLLTTASNSRKGNGYFGAAFWQPEHQQFVIAHRGTANLGTLRTDLEGVLCNKHVPQMESASTFAQKVVEVLREVKDEKRVSFQLFFTGHSLGGWLAQVTTFTTEYLKMEENIFRQNNDDLDCFHPHTVVFDSPGCKNILLQMTDKLDVRHDGRSIDIDHLDITTYLSAPNRINTCNKHVGTVYRIFPDLSDMGFWETSTALYNTATHSMENIVQAFDPETGQVHKDDRGQLKIQVVIDWPISVGILGGEEYKSFFEWATHFNNYHPNIKDISFQHLHCIPIRYQTKLYDERLISFSIFSEEEQDFLQCYRWLRQWPEFFKSKELFSELKENQAKENAQNVLECFEIESGTVRCTDASALQELIPYVKRLLQLFPEIKENTKLALSSDEVRNRVYLFETRRYDERIRQSKLEFNSDASGFREFLESKEQKVLNLRMIKGNEWTGLIMVHQVLQKAGCLTEGQYTVLKLKRLLKLNKLMDLSKLMQSTVTPHLLLMACDDSQQLDEESKDVIRTLFDTVKQKPNIKIIFTTQSVGNTVDFLHHMLRRISGEGFVTRIEELTWCNLTCSSQDKLLEKSVQFQGSKLSLHDLISAKSPVTKFLSLDALLDEKELTIADPVPITKTYNEDYYIGRIFHQKKIKQDIFRDKSLRDSHVYLSRTEQEFKDLCELYPNSTVHWLEKDKSGKLILQQSQGGLETLRSYIDTESSQTYTPDDLDKLLEQAKQKRVMLISDTAGMGKSTVVTNLSKRIKQKFPGKWVLRIDLNDHTDALNALKEETIDKEKVTEFVSEKMLKLKPGLEKELFKQCCEQEQKIRIVIMLDGFDKISPTYKETVIGLLQALRQTAVEQLWVTTRPHLREELEDKLQQLSYELEPFSEKNQIEFLRKFWSLRDWFTGTENKDEKRENKLEVFAGHLIKELANSISDKHREFTGIPLQTRMLAEAFDEEVRIFFQSGKSMPEVLFKLNLLELYEKFIERKYDIYQKEKSQVPVNNVGAIGQRERDLKIMREDHQLLALKVLFTEEQVTQLQNNSQCTFSVENLTRFGIVQVGDNGTPHFIHRTFAEYYVADFLVNRLTKGSNASEQVLTFILKVIFIEYDFTVIRAFVDGLLSRCKISEEMLKQYGNWIHDLKECDYKILHRSAFEGNANITGFLLDSVQAGKHGDTVNKLLLTKDEEGLTAWNVAALFNNTHVLERIWECAEKELTEEELKSELLLAGVTVKHKSWGSEAWWGREDPLRSWRYEGRRKNEAGTVWHVAAYLGNLNLLQKLWEWAKGKLTTYDKKEIVLFGTDEMGRTVWHLASKGDSWETLLQLWEWAKEKLTTEEINKFLLSTDDMERTAWHWAAERGRSETLQKLWECAKEKISKDELNKLLLCTDNEGMTALHLAAISGNSETLQKLWQCAKEILTTEELNKLLLGTDNGGMTAWLLAADRGTSETLQKVWQCAKEILTTEELNKLLLGTDNKGMTAWHLAAVWGTSEILQKVWECAKRILTTEELNKLLLGTDKQGKTAWHLAATSGNTETLQNVWKCAKKILTTEKLNKLLLGTDNGGMTAWHLAAVRGTSESLQKVWQCAKEILTTEELIKLLLGTNSKGMTAWHLAADCGTSETLQKGWECAKEILITEELNKLLLGTDNRGMTAWHLAADWGTPEILQKVWEYAKGILSTEELNKLLLGTDNQGKTAWHLAATSGHTETLQKVWQCAKEILTREELNKLLLVGLGFL